MAGCSRRAEQAPCASSECCAFSPAARGAQRGAHVVQLGCQGSLLAALARVGHACWGHGGRGTTKPWRCKGSMVLPAGGGRGSLTHGLGKGFCFLGLGTPRRQCRGGRQRHGSACLYHERSSQQHCAKWLCKRQSSACLFDSGPCLSGAAARRAQGVLQSVLAVPDPQLTGLRGGCSHPLLQAMGCATARLRPWIWQQG